MHDIGAGLRTWPKNMDKKRQHFVARFVLANFASGEATGKKRIVQLDKTRGEPRHVLPEEAASRRRFYAVESEESPHDNRIEDFLSLVEGYAAEPIRTLLERPTELSEADRTTIALLLALQERRTPYGIAEAGAAAERFGRESLAALALDPEAFGERWRELSDDGKGPVDVEAARLEVLAIATEGRLHLDSQREQGLLAMMEGWLAAAEILDLMHWHLLRPASGREFIQNDQGVARLDSSTTFTAPEVTPQWLFPLAPDACLMVREGSRALSFHGSTDAGTTDINLRIYGWAERFVFGRTQAAVTETRTAAEECPAKAGGPPWGSRNLDKRA